MAQLGDTIIKGDLNVLGNISTNGTLTGASNVYTKTETDIKLGTKQDKLTAGTNITISNNTISAKDTTYENATQESDGIMSKEDKQKLDSLSNYDDTTIKEEIANAVNEIEGIKEQINPTGWYNASLTSYLKGLARYVRIGNIVIVNFDEVKINQDITQHATALATGLPKASISGLHLLTNYDTKAYLRIAITGEGIIQNHWSNASASDNVWYGTLIYITNE